MINTIENHLHCPVCKNGVLGYVCDGPTHYSGKTSEIRFDIFRCNNSCYRVFKVVYAHGDAKFSVRIVEVKNEKK